jgi:hypothetical protein
VFFYTFAYKQIKLFLCLTNWAPRHEGVWGNGCLDSRALDLGTSWRWVLSFTPRPLYDRKKSAGTHWIGGWVGPRTGLDYVEKRKILSVPGLRLRPLGVSSRSQSLYRLRCLGLFQGVLKEVTRDNNWCRQCFVVKIFVFCRSQPVSTLSTPWPTA